jgi:hypothetical protein
MRRRHVYGQPSDDKNEFGAEKLDFNKETMKENLSLTDKLSAVDESMDI